MRKVLISILCILTLTLVITKLEQISEPSKEMGKMATMVKETFESVIKYFPFTQENALSEWQEKILKGRTVYSRETAGNGAYVRADSNKTASMLYYKISIDVKSHPVIKWKWLATDFPSKKMPERINYKKEEDYAGRVYVAFPAPFFTNSKAIAYIWAKDMPVGTRGESPYSKNIKVVVLRSGDSKGEWMSEERDIYEDYVSLFGEKPRLNIGGISFMTNSDNTKTHAMCLYAEIKLVEKEPHAN